jgi:tol-pal system protein YbgF
MICLGCATTQETGALNRSVDTLAQQMQSMENRLERLERQVQGGGEGNTGLANLYARIEEMQVKLGAVNGQLEGQGRQIENLKKQVSSPPPVSTGETSSVGPRITMPEAGGPNDAPPPPAARPAPSTASAPPPPATATPAAPSATAKAATPTPPPAAAPPKSVNPEKAHFDRALQSFQQGQYESARKDFQDFIAKYPSSDAAPTAVFWTGESYYAEKRYRDAISAYQQILDRYPKASRVPYALLKQGNAFEQLGNPTAARILYEKLLDQYPNSPQAQVAGKKLKELQ